MVISTDAGFCLHQGWNQKAGRVARRLLAPKSHYRYQISASNPAFQVLIPNLMAMVYQLAVVISTAGIYVRNKPTGENIEITLDEFLMIREFKISGKCFSPLI